MGGRKPGLRGKLPVLSTTGPISIWMIIFVMLPMIYVFVISFLTSDPYGGIEAKFTFENYTEMLQPLYLKVILKSFKLAFYTTAICLLVGYPMAYWIASKRPSTAAKMLMLVMIPYWTSSLVRLYSANLLAMPNGFLNTALMKLHIISEPLDLLYSDTMVLMGLLIACLPFSVLPLYSSIEKLDKSLIEASKDLGARPVQTFFKVIVPQTMPGIIGCIILVFTNISITASDSYEEIIEVESSSIYRCLSFFPFTKITFSLVYHYIYTITFIIIINKISFIIRVINPSNSPLSIFFAIFKFSLINTSIFQN